MFHLVLTMSITFLISCIVLFTSRSSIWFFLNVSSSFFLYVAFFYIFEHIYSSYDKVFINFIISIMFLFCITELVLYYTFLLCDWMINIETVHYLLSVFFIILLKMLRFCFLVDLFWSILIYMWISPNFFKFCSGGSREVLFSRSFCSDGNVLYLYFPRW